MRNLNALLERFSRLLNKDTAIKEAVAGVIEEKTRVRLSHEQINLKEGVLQITAGSAAKNEIALREELIKSELKALRGVAISKILYK